MKVTFFQKQANVWILQFYNAFYYTGRCKWTCQVSEVHEEV